MSKLVAPLAGFSLLFQQPVHGAHRAVIDAFVEQSRIHRGRRAVLETFFMQHAVTAARSTGFNARGDGPAGSRRRHRRGTDLHAPRGRRQDGGDRTKCDSRRDSQAGCTPTSEDRYTAAFMRASRPFLPDWPESPAAWPVFWTSMMMPALRRSSVRRAFWLRSLPTSASSEFCRDLRPRLAGVRPLRMPASRSRRQFTRSDEYRRSRRNIAPRVPVA